MSVRVGTVGIGIVVDAMLGGHGTVPISRVDKQNYNCEVKQ